MNKQRFILDIGLFMLVVVILLLLTNYVSATNVTSKHPKWNNTKTVSFQRWTEFVTWTAIQTKSDDPFIEVKNVDKLVRDNIVWQRRGNIKSLRETWISHKGDCTEIALSICYFLNNQDIPCRTVHGFTERGLHDWYEYEINNTWYSNETNNFSYLKRVGVGIW